MRLRLLPLAITTMTTLAVVKLGALTSHMIAPSGNGPSGAATGLMGAAHAQGRTETPPPVSPAPTPAEAASRATRAVAAMNPEPGRTNDPIAEAERAILEQLRARHQALEARENALAERERMLGAIEARLSRRAQELDALRRELEALEARRSEREQAGWQGLVRVYEQMRPRDAAAIFNELPMEVLLEIVDRMTERRAAPILAAMNQERARDLTTELARLRAAKAAHSRL